jgi:hypothetical protein
MQSQLLRIPPKSIIGNTQNQLLRLTPKSIIGNNSKITSQLNKEKLPLSSSDTQVKSIYLSKLHFQISLQRVRYAAQKLSERTHF